MKRLFIFLLMGFSCPLFAQTGTIKGIVANKYTNEPIPFANIIIQESTKGAAPDGEGNYAISNLEPELYNLEASFIGFKKLTIYEVEVFKARVAYANFALEEEAEQLEELVVVASGFEKNEESPVSLRSIGVNEIKRNPGGNRDISRR